ncbi:TetR/AcrR family transcriptional regulator [Agrococcus carbonis]|uniref:DNA-binding transcriptional regulator, AcrR family n=1 Tax=Agrococcus carbonis TaxID=684552 RepID=A0A1H1L3F3_9MICO|nr:TetR/AcrR family transcriptional regulator [Agrococcus carbonis]SDR69114.1 DNA-binding transcriptional regulator, AcrR family [Agrococcus carbonis]
MDERGAASPSHSVTVRHEPVQARAAHRIEALLDAAAAVVVEQGIEHLTTALVAERAGASIGTVYRYFPDRVAVLVALAERNFERLRHAIEREMAAEHATWGEAMEGIVGAMVETFRSVPSFRALRTGEGLDLGPESREPVAPIFVADVERYLRERWGVEMDDARRGDLELAIGSLDALVTYAFMHDPDGDPRYLALGMELARQHLTRVIGDDAA